jgi:hypothetical protein
VKDSKGRQLNIIWDSLEKTSYKTQLKIHFEAVNRLWLTPTTSSVTRVQKSTVESKYTQLLSAFL